jgi:hypothetical protein
MPINGIWNPTTRIPEGQSGTYKIKHTRRPAGHREPTASMRTALLGGHARQDVQFDHPTTWTSLEYEGGTWMSDKPIEQVQIDAHMKGFRGRVLVGGLGLGYAANKLVDERAADSVLVIEKSPDVIDLVEPYTSGYGAEMEVECADLFEVFRKSPKEHAIGCAALDGDPTPFAFDHAFLDIWQTDSEATGHYMIAPLVRMAHTNRWCAAENIACWNQDIVAGQLINTLHHRAMIALGYMPDALTMGGGVMVNNLPWWTDARGDIWHDWMVPFFRMIDDESDEYARPGHDFLLGMATEYVWAYLTRPDVYDEKYEQTPTRIAAVGGGATPNL